MINSVAVLILLKIGYSSMANKRELQCYTYYALPVLGRGIERDEARRESERKREREREKDATSAKARKMINSVAVLILLKIISSTIAN